MNQEMNFTDPELELAMSEIRGEGVDDAAMEAAAARVWARLSTVQADHGADHIGDCAGFRALIPEFRAGSLPETRAILIKDHLHECVACRRVYEGRVVSMPAVAAAQKPRTNFRLAVAAAVVASAGATIWLTVDRSGSNTGQAIVQAVNGSLFAVTAQGITPLLAGQQLPDGVEIRTAKDSDAMLKLRDGSLVEMRERSGFSASQSSADLTLRLLRGSVIVQAAKREAGHLYVFTNDCRVAVTGTIFEVSAGAKGSRVSVVQGEVHVDRDNKDNVVHPGGQLVTSPDMEPQTVREDIAWSRDHERYFTLLEQIKGLQTDLQQISMPGLRYSSGILKRLPASTKFYAGIPNLTQYLGEAQIVLQRKLADSPALREWWSTNEARTAPFLEKLRGAGEYLGEEIVMAALEGGGGPAFVSEIKKPGFEAFLKKIDPRYVAIERNGLVIFGPAEDARKLADAMDNPKGGMETSPLYKHIVEAYSHGTGFLLCADVSRQAGSSPIAGAEYLIATERQTKSQLEAELTLGFKGERTGLAAWLAAPGPMGALDYVEPDATALGAFLVKDPGVIIDQVSGIMRKSSTELGAARAALSASLGGEFAIALGNTIMPVPAWKLVAEVYDAAAAQTAIQQAIQLYNDDAVKAGKKPLDVAQETVEGRVYYSFQVPDAGPLMDFHYTFADGYLIAAPSRVLLERAIEVKASGTSIQRSSKFAAMMPHDRHSNFSGLLYQNLGTTLAPVMSLLGGMGPANAHNPMSQLGNMKPSLITAYGEPDKISFATNGDVLGPAVAGLMGGNLGGIAAGSLPFLPMFQQGHARQMQVAR